MRRFSEESEPEAEEKRLAKLTLLRFHVIIGSFSEIISPGFI